MALTRPGSTMSPGTSDRSSGKGGNVQKREKKLLSVAGIVLGGTLLLSGCGNSTHVVSGATSAPTETSATSGSATTGVAGLGDSGAKSGSSKSTSVTSKKASSPTKSSAGGSPGSGSSGSQPPSSVNQQTLNGFDAQLGALGQNLSQAISGVNDTQGDS
jgi:hypothetical protein